MNQSENKNTPKNQSEYLNSLDRDYFNESSADILIIDAFKAGHSQATASLIQTIENRIAELGILVEKYRKEKWPTMYKLHENTIQELNNLLTLMKS